MLRNIDISFGAARLRGRERAVRRVTSDRQAAGWALAASITLCAVSGICNPPAGLAAEQIQIQEVYCAGHVLFDSERGWSCRFSDSPYWSKPFIGT